MPNWKPVLVITLLSGAAIWLLFPGYVALQTAPTPDIFLGELGDQADRASAAAVMDGVFAVSYALLGVIAYEAVAVGVPRLIGSAAAIGAAVADEVENLYVFLNARAGGELTQSGIDTMATAGNIKWGLVFTAVVLLLALAGQQWLESRRQ